MCYNETESLRFRNKKIAEGDADVHEEILKVNNVSFRYAEQDVIKNVSLTLHRGELLGLVGPNGSGKSTLLKLILGLLPLRRGEVYWFGVPLSRFREWPRIGYVSQKASSFNTGFPATVEEVVLMGLTAKLGLFRRPGRRERRAVEDVLELVGMEEFKKRTIGALSGGQQQRVFIARALVTDPEVLILDEPTVGVDMRSEERFYELLEKLHRERALSMILVSHDLGVVSQKMDTIACINHELFYHGTAEHFRDVQDEVVLKTYGREMQVITHSHAYGSHRRPAFEACWDDQRAYVRGESDAPEKEAFKQTEQGRSSMQATRAEKEEPTLVGGDQH
ncbi:MAG: Zinc ABC transporter, ATP-binding protein ZnuC [Candidatus Carbobacillus altaicus]|uniref:Zinc ABC transporter, ATP-binding protein ZnuC n=1 Tax=Candidatus Carbonibacillus altaicus TaxID=2163959 RepID=A0A2R6Y1G7_9BACL|nr:MAG: Zinc ABC transporter, ATP-binding protein ZnuC [Candidatus Carbobacillus altaicus]